MTSPQPISTLPSQREDGDLSRSARAERTDTITAELAACHDPAVEQRLRDELIAINMPVAASIARRYRSRGIAVDDLQQVAFLALTKAAQRFDPRSGYAFLSFSVPTVRGEVRRYFRDHGWMVRPPRRIQELQHQLLQARARLTTTLGRPPSEQELADEVGAELPDVREALDGRGCFSPTSLDRRSGEDGEGAPLGELLGEDDHRQQAVEARVVLAPAVRRLSERDRRILRLRFYDGCTQREIADDIGVTQMQVSRLLSRIFHDLREGIGDPAGNIA